MSISDDVDRDEYVDRWHSHLAELQRLKPFLDDEQADVLADTREQLDRLVDAAAENREAQRAAEARAEIEAEAELDRRRERHGENRVSNRRPDR